MYIFYIGSILYFKFIVNKMLSCFHFVTLQYFIFHGVFLTAKHVSKLVFFFSNHLCLDCYTIVIKISYCYICITFFIFYYFFFYQFISQIFFLFLLNCLSHFDSHIHNIYLVFLHPISLLYLYKRLTHNRYFPNSLLKFYFP